MVFFRRRLSQVFSSCYKAQPHRLSASHGPGLHRDPSCWTGIGFQSRTGTREKEKAVKETTAESHDHHARTRFSG
ncbi:unnamed protein product [Arctogadus glacialis]